MDPIQVHLALHHVPSVGAVSALILLGWGLYRRSSDLTIAALWAFVVVALVAIPVYLSGGGIGARIAALPQVSPDLIVHHRESAMAAMIGIESAAATAMAALFAWRSSRRFPGFAATATFVVGIVATILVLRTASLGGRIRHTELNPPANVAVRPDGVR